MEDPTAEGHETSLSDEGRYRLLLESVTDYAIYMLDPDGTIVSWNAGAPRFKGYMRDEIIGSHFSQFYTDEDRATNLPGHALSTAATDGRFESEGWRVRTDGSRFWAHVIIDAIRNAKGELVGFGKITRDLTERRAAEESLRRSEELFKLLVQSVTDYSLYMLSPEGLVVSWNAGAERIKGYRADEIIGEHFSRFYIDEDRAAGLPAIALQKAAAEGRFEKEGWRVRKDGTHFWANVVIDSIRDSRGKLIGFAKITRDITERRDSQIALEKAREALFQSQKMEAIGQLTGGIAHDFNNLLTAILGSLEIARRRIDGDKAILPLIDNAIRGAERGAGLTRRMLTFARHQELSLAPTDVPALIRGMTDLLERSLGPAVMIETRFPLFLKWVIADPNQLEMAILNLTVNARDAMPEGGTIVIGGRHERVFSGHDKLAPGDYVCLSITDTGEGMDEATLVRAVEPFYTTKGVGKGTGLGLSMVLGLAEQSGGQLILKSKKGVGTTVELWLPVAPKTPATAGEPVEEEAPHVAVASPRLRILAVDDDPLVLTNLIAMLEDVGHDVVGVSSGEEALAVLHRELAFDLMITDQAMPRMTGMELIALVENAWPKLPIILATGYAELPEARPSRLPRLSKPFLQHHLLDAISDALRLYNSRRVVRFPNPKT